MEAVKPATTATVPTSSALNSAPVIASVRLSPAAPVPGETVTADVDVSDADGDAVSLSYQWRIDNELVGTGSSVHVDGAKGAQITVTVTPSDGNSQGVSETASLRVGNLPPVIQGVVIEPLDQVRAGRDVAASPRATDPDGDEVSFSYRWDVNGSTIVEARGAVLASEHFERGDTIRLTVWASDGNAESAPLKSGAIEVVNAPPRVTSTPGAIGDDGVFRYPIVAEDPDGDRDFRYRLLEGPDGMEIDVVAGSLVWAPGESQSGSHPVKLEVSDLKGGKTLQGFVINVGFEDVPADTPES